MTEPSSIGCPHCGQRYQMTPEQQAVYRGRTITCQQCAKPFTVDDRVPGGTIAVGGAAGAGAATAPPPPQQPAAGYAPPPGGAPVAGYATPPGYGPYGAPPPRKSGMPVLVILGIVGVVGVVVIACLISILLPSLNRAREQANRIKCASNMRQVGLAMMMYANENKGQLPDTLDILLKTQDITADVFVCPSSDLAVVPGATTLTPGQNLSYVYVGKGMQTYGTNVNAGTTVVMYEPMTDHNNDGMNVLFLDGHVEFFGKQQAPQMMKDLENGVNPPSVLPQ